MPFVKTEVDIREDYVVETVDPQWLKEGVKSPKHLMLDPDNCILCRACEDVCPWNCIFMLSPEITITVSPVLMLSLLLILLPPYSTSGARETIFI